MKYHERARAIFAADRLSQSDRLILLAISDHVGSDGGWAWPSAGGLAEKCAMSERGVRKRLQAMVEAGALIEEKRPGYSSRLLICWDTLSGHSMRLRLVCEDAHTPEPRSPRNDVHPGTTFRSTPERRSAPPGTTFRTPRNDVPTNGKGTDQETENKNGESKPAATAPESGKPDDPIRALWDKWEPKRVEVYGGRVGKLTKARRSAMRARIIDHSAEEVGLVLAWWLTSSHERATFLRANGCTWDTVLRPTKFPAYLEMAGQAAESRRQRALPIGSDQTERTALEAIAKMRALYADHGSLPYDKMPPAIVGALREIGGIRYLFGAVNDFQQRDRTNAFVAAYRRHAAGTENG